MSQRCSDLSRAAGVPLSASATTAEKWLLLEVPGSWHRDVSSEGGLPAEAHEAVTAWLADTPRSRLQFIRRSGRSSSGRSLAFVVDARENGGNVRRIELADQADLARVDLDTAGEPVDGSLVLVCGHGSRDACCALRGTAVFGALAERLGEEELWISSHQGGHRFAANVLVLPAGMHFGRVEPGEAPFLVARALAGRIELDRYRGRTCFEPIVQAAEQAVREATGLDVVSELELTNVEGSTVRFRSWEGAEHIAIVEEVAGPVAPASCGADPEAQRVLRARVV
ncbi:MAG: hypothetical protein A2Y55_02010 [Actinobacteria bacterium RBG_16_68_12]|nr:MAG: hypothetical protein A2Y55_02010 [Actinobacteria bacterium RBG_16_68_12]